MEKRKNLKDELIGKKVCDYGVESSVVGKGGIMDLNELEYNMRTNNVQEVIRIIADIGDKKYEEAIPLLIKYLQDTDNNILRNEIAIALSDIGCHEAVEPIIKMIKSAKTIGNRGTLLYALESFDNASHIEMIVDLLYEDNFEVSRQALILIERMINDVPVEIKQKYIWKMRNEIENLQDKIDFLTESLEVLL